MRLERSLLLPAACITAVMLSSCATRKSGETPPTPLVVPVPNGGVKTAVPRPPRERDEKRPPVRVSLAPPSPGDVEPPTAAPAANLTPSERIARLVQEGRLASQSETVLVFARTRALPHASAGLYEDGITLGRLRGELRDVEGLPASAVTAVTVRDTRAYLKLSKSLPPDVVARAIDAALRTEGILSVQTTLSS